MEILIVEDDRASRSLLYRFLTKMGHTVIEASDGQQALELMNLRPVRIVISDWMMPGMDGLDLCRHIRQASFDGYVYFIVATVRDRKADLLTVFDAGADDYLCKPLDFDELRARVITGLRWIDLETHHLQLQRSLVQSRNKLRVAFNALEEKIVSLNPELMVVSVNKAGLNGLNLDVSKVVGRPFHDFFNPYVEESVLRVLAEGKRHEFLLKEQRFDGMGYEKVVCVPVLNAADRVVNVVVVMKDVTEDYRKSEEIESLNQRLVNISTQVEAKNIKLEKTLKRLEQTQAQMIHSEKMASIGQLAAGVAHEINNPTGFVSSNLKTLAGYKTDIAKLIVKYQSIRDQVRNGAFATDQAGGLSAQFEEVARFEETIDIDYLMTDISALIDDCRDGMERIKKIVMDLKDFAHPGNEEQQLVDINRSLDSTLNVVHNEIKYKATIDKSYGKIPLIQAYPQQLNQVFMNIFINAAQAIEKCGSISIETSSCRDNVEVRISDTGCGISPENISKIFDPFFTTKEVGKGTGLGMHIAYNIVQKHHGTIQVNSRVGQGTTFTIQLPREPS